MLFDLVTEAIESIRWARDFYETKQFLYVQTPSDTRDVARAYPTGWPSPLRSLGGLPAPAAAVTRCCDQKDNGYN